MSVYVDDMITCIPNKHWPYIQNCHLVADSLLELHAFAETLELKKSWLQTPQYNLPHFDLTENMRRKAVKQGAVEISRKRFVEILREWRKRK